MHILYGRCHRHRSADVGIDACFNDILPLYCDKVLKLSLSYRTWMTLSTLTELYPDLHVVSVIKPILYILREPADDRA